MADPRDLLAPQNVNRENLLSYAREAADFCTSKQLPSLDYAVNAQNTEDIAMFDFTSMYAAENAAMIFEMKGHRLLTCLAGDSLMEVSIETNSLGWDQQRSCESRFQSRVTFSTWWSTPNESTVIGSS